MHRDTDCNGLEIQLFFYCVFSVISIYTVITLVHFLVGV